MTRPRILFSCWPWFSWQHTWLSWPFVEAIIGASLPGWLKPALPHTSPLMNRIEFAGNAIFIPFFLITVGMLVDLRVLLKGPDAFSLLVH